MSGYCSAHIHHDPTCHVCSFTPAEESIAMPANKSDYDINITATLRLDNVTRAELTKEVEKLRPLLAKFGVEVKTAEAVAIAPPA